jgi:hypothetical protein
VGDHSSDCFFDSAGVYSLTAVAQVTDLYFSDTFCARINLPDLENAADQSQESSNNRSPKMER